MIWYPLLSILVVDVVLYYLYFSMILLKIIIS